LNEENGSKTSIKKSTKESFDPKVSLEISDLGDVELGNISPANSSMQALRTFLVRQGVRASSSVKRFSMSESFHKDSFLSTFVSSKATSTSYNKSGITGSSSYGSKENKYRRSYSSSSYESNGSRSGKRKMAGAKSSRLRNSKESLISVI